MIFLGDKIRVDQGQLKAYSDKLRSYSELVNTFFKDLNKEINSMSSALDGKSAESYKDDFRIINDGVAKKTADILEKAADAMDETVRRLIAADEDLARKLGIAQESRALKMDYKDTANVKFSNVDLRTKSGLADTKVGLSMCIGDPVNAATGNFILEDTDIFIDGVNPIEFKRYYNSLDKWNGNMGRNWHHNFPISLKRLTESIAEITDEDGHVEYFMLREDGWFSAEPEKNNRLDTNENGEYILKRPDKIVYCFSTEGVLIYLKNNRGLKTNLIYDDSGYLEKVENSSGTLNFLYDDEKIIKIYDNAKRFIEYGYSDGNLSSFKNVDGNLFTYEYDESNRLTCLIDPLNNVTVRNIYDDNGRAIEQTMADGTINKYRYDDVEGATFFTEGNGVEVIYKRDDKFRIYETIYINGSEKVTFDDKNQVTAITDKNKNTYHYSYDYEGNMVRESNPLGHITEYTYNKDGLVTAIKNPDSGIYRYNYDKSGNLTCVKDPLERKLDIEYNTSGQPEKILMPDGSFYGIKYNENGNPLEVKDPMENMSKLLYDELNRVRCVIKPEGNKYEFSYTPGGKIKKIVYPDGTFEKSVYDQRGLLVQMTYVSGNSQKSVYNSMGKLIEKIDPLGGSTKYEYDAMWNIIKIIKPDLSEISFKYNDANLMESMTNEEGFTVNCEYDSNNNLIKMVDPKGNETKYYYDVLNRLVEAVDANSAVNRYEYTWDGRIQKVIDALNGVAVNEYDLAGQLVCSSDQIGNSTRYTYNSCGLLESVTDPKGGVLKYEYDSAGRVIKLINPDETHINLEYNKNGKVVGVIDGKDNKTCFEYDSMERVIKMVNAEGGTRLMEYTKSGEVALLIDENGGKTHYEYDALDRLTKVIDANGGKTEYVYDAVGNLLEIHQFAGITKEIIDGMHPYKEIEESMEPYSNKMITSFKYDKRGLLLEEKNPAGLVTVYTYDESGNLSSQTDREGYIRKLQYDSLNNLKRVTYHDGRQVEYEHDILGRITGLKDWLGKTDFKLDALGRITKVKDYANRITEYVWGVGDERKLIKYPDGTTISYEYDIVGRLRKVQDMQKGLTSYNYDASGNIIEKILPNKAKSLYKYDRLNRLTSLSNIDVNNDILESYRYKYDMAGNRTSIEKNRSIDGWINGETHYTYDPLKQLVKVERPDSSFDKFFYDSIGNRVRMETWNKNELSEASDYIYDNQSRLTKIIGRNKNDLSRQISTIMEYDKRGNIISTKLDGILTGKFDFNVLNQLETVTNRQGDVSKYIYDGLGRRVGSVIGGQQSHYILDNTKKYFNVLMTIGKNSGINSYVYGLDLTSVSTKEGIHHYMNDDLGSPLNILDNKGNAVFKYDYDDFGTPIMLKKPCENNYSMVNPISFTGYQYDQSTGLQYAHARYYMPKIGRFISEDSYKGKAIEPLSLNRFTYCQNNPVMYIDPTGHWLHILAGALIGGTVSAGAKLIGDLVAGEDLQWEGYAAAFASGAVIGGFAAATGGASLLATGVYGAAIDAGVTTLVETGLKTITTGENQFNWGTLLKFGEGFVTNLAFGKLADVVVKTNLGSKIFNFKAIQSLVNSNLGSKMAGVLNKLSNTKLVQTFNVERIMTKIFTKKADSLFNGLTRRQLYTYLKNLEMKDIITRVTTRMNKRKLIEVFNKEIVEVIPKRFAESMVRPASFVIGNTLTKITYSKVLGQIFGFNMENDYYNDTVNYVFDKISHAFNSKPQCAS